MKISDAEWQWDRRKLTLYFTAEQRVDFRALVRDLAAVFRTRIELRQIGARDEARRLSGIGRCGREYCSASWLPELRPVNLSVAKDQHLSLNPSQISGPCGRLLCCLHYEHEFYVQSRKRFPKEGKVLQTAVGPERVLAVDIFRDRVTLRSEEHGTRVVALDRLHEEMGSAAPDLAAAPNAFGGGSWSYTLNAGAVFAGAVVINEIMYNAAVPNATFVEIYNTSLTTAFDLSGWQIPELSYTFPSGSLINPGAFLVLAANRASYAAAYGAIVPLFDTFPGTLDPQGGLLTLLSSSNSSGASVVTRVRYSSSAPWPDAAGQTGASQQLIDPHQDNWRAGNWSLSAPGTVCVPASTMPRATSFLRSSAGSLYEVSTAA